MKIFIISIISTIVSLTLAFALKGAAGEVATGLSIISLIFCIAAIADLIDEDYKDS